MAEDRELLEILLLARADMREATDALNELARQAKKSAEDAAEAIEREYTQALTTVRNQAAVAFAGFAAAMAISIKEAGDAQSVLLRTRAAVEMVGGSWAEWGDKLQATANQIQLTTRYSDEMALTTLARLITVTGDVSRATELWGLSLDLASRFNLDAEQGARMVGMAAEGVTGRLGMLIPAIQLANDELGETATRSERGARYIEILRAKVGGFAEREAKAFNAQMVKSRNAIGEMAEKIGNAFLPVMLNLLDKTQKVALAVADWAGKHETLVTIVGGGALIITGFVASMTTIALLLPKIAAGIGAISVALTGLVSKHPYLLAIAAGLTLIGLAYLYISTKIRDAEAELDESTKWLDEQIVRIREYIALKREAAAADLTVAQLKLRQEWEKGAAALTELQKTLEGQVKTTAAANQKNLDFIAILENLKQQYAAQPTLLAAVNILLEEYRSRTETAAVQTAFFAQTFLDLMNAGLSAAAALKLAHIPTLPEVTIEVESPEATLAKHQAIRDVFAKRRLDAFQALVKMEADIQQSALAAGMSDWAAAEVMKTSKTKEEAKIRIQIWRDTYDRQRELMSGLEAAHTTLITSFANTEMTGSQRIKAVWQSLLSAYLSHVAQMLAKHIFGTVARAAADKAAAGAAVAANTTAAVAEGVTAKVLEAAWYKVAFARLLAFFSFAGPGAPGLAAGVIAAAKAISVGLAVAGAAMQRGGRVPGAGKGDTVPVLLEPGEIVIRNPIAGQFADFLLSLNEGRYDLLNNPALPTGGNVTSERNEYYLNVPVTFSRPLSIPETMTFRDRLMDELGPVLDDMARRRRSRVLQSER